jgi:hypothetical protein
MSRPGWDSVASSRLCDCVSNKEPGPRVKVGLRRLDMPTTKIELDHGYEPLDGIVNLRHWKKSLRMRHETRSSQHMPSISPSRATGVC